MRKRGWTLAFQTTGQLTSGLHNHHGCRRTCIHKRIRTVKNTLWFEAHKLVTLDFTVDRLSSGTTSTARQLIRAMPFSALRTTAEASLTLIVASDNCSSAPSFPPSQVDDKWLFCFCLHFRQIQQKFSFPDLSLSTQSSDVPRNPCTSMACRNCWNEEVSVCFVRDQAVGGGSPDGGDCCDGRTLH